MSTNLFNIANRLKSYSVYIDKYELLQEMIVSIDILYDVSTPKLKAYLFINDVYNLNDVVTWSEIEIKIEYMDLFDTLVTKKFKVLNIREYKYNINGKALFISLQDTFSYAFERSYLSKGYNDNPSVALTDYIEKLNLKKDYQTDFSKLDNKYRFIIPKSQNNLEFFISEFQKYGYNFYQTKDKICLKSQEDQKPSSLYEHSDIFLDATDNQLYKNRIIEHRVVGTNKESLQPKTRSIAFDPETKSMKFYNNNDNKNLLLNDDTTNIQDTNGYRDVYQQHLNFGEHDQKLKDSLLKQGQIEIIVNGYGKNELNQIYNLELKGNAGSNESYNKGNTIISGKYISTKISDKIINNSFVQKILLERADAQKKI